MSIRRISIQREFLSSDEIATLLEYCRRPETDWWQTSHDDPWNDRTLPHQMTAPDISRLLVAIRSRVIKTVEETSQVNKPLYADGLSLTRWRVGEEQGPHADRENPNGTPHLYPWRDYGAILYLNSDFEGGELYFPHLNKEPEISAGMLAFFPGDKAFIHGVRPVTSGIRYTLALFLTHDETHKDWA